MEMQQMIERLLAEQEEMKAKADADREQMLTRMEANTKSMREDIKCGQAVMRSIIRTIEGKMDAWIAHMRDDWKEMTFCQETKEARLEC
jgi:hypothetical protein